MDEYGVRISAGAAFDPSARWSASTADADVILDPTAVRDLDLFFSRVAPAADEVVSRPIVVWKGEHRFVVDMHARSDRGVWHLTLGEARPDDASPDQAVTVDPRLNDLTTPVWVTDADRLARWFNAAWCQFVGASLEDELGWGWMRHAHPDDLVGLLQVYDEAQRECRGFDHVMRIMGSDNQLRWAHVRALPRATDTGFAGFIGICMVTDLADTEPPMPSGVPPRLPIDSQNAETSFDVIARLQSIETTLQIVRPAQILETVMLRRLASTWVKEHRALAPHHDDIVLAVGEAAANAVVHGYGDEHGDVELTCVVRDAHAEFRMRDWGSWKTVPAAHDGRGLAIMRALSDEFELRHLSDGTEVVLRYHLR